jgi:GTP-binding protein
MGRAASASMPHPAGLPVIAIIGRPNAGKSTLFNRLIGARKAIVDDFPGVTRDRNYAEAVWRGQRYLLVDTGGIDGAGGSELEQSVHAQSRLALAEADAVILLLDGKSGLSPLDREVVELLRKSSRPVFVAVNKLDSARRSENLFEFYSLGIDRLYPISAEHGLGIADLLDAVLEALPVAAEDGASAGENGVTSESGGENSHAPSRVAVVGRPNVGKSTLINRLLGFERAVVDATPGTTRDVLETPFHLRGERCVLVDTAGIRRKARIDDRVERFSAQRALRAVDDADLIIHVIDGTENVTDQDAQILGYAAERGKAVVLAVNKWDLLAAAGVDGESYRAEIYYRLSFLDYAPVCFISAVTGHGLRKLQETAALVLQGHRRKVSTSQFNQALQKSIRGHAPPLSQGRAVKFYYGTQTGSRPPTFTLFVNRPRAVPESYRRYLTHQLREQLDLAHAPIKLILRPRREGRE